MEFLVLNLILDGRLLIQNTVIFTMEKEIVLNLILDGRLLIQEKITKKL